MKRKQHLKKLRDKLVKQCKQITELQSDEAVEKDTKSIKSKIFTKNESYDNLRQFEKTELQNEGEKIENLLSNEDIDELSKTRLLKEYHSELKIS